MNHQNKPEHVEDIRLLKLEYMHPKYLGAWLFIGFLYTSQEENNLLKN